jgi:hypothetical protein
VIDMSACGDPLQNAQIDGITIAGIDGVGASHRVHPC